MFSRSLAISAALGRAYRDDSSHHLRIERLSRTAAGGFAPPTTFGIALGRMLVAGIFAFWRKGQKKIARDISLSMPVVIGQRRPLFSRIGNTSSSVVPG